MDRADPVPQPLATGRCHPIEGFTRQRCTAGPIVT